MLRRRESDADGGSDGDGDCADICGDGQDVIECDWRVFPCVCTCVCVSGVATASEVRVV